MNKTVQTKAAGDSPVLPCAMCLLPFKSMMKTIEHEENERKCPRICKFGRINFVLFFLMSSAGKTALPFKDLGRIRINT